MATRITTTFQCDSTYKSHADESTIETVTMSVNGETTEMDLCSVCRDRWLKAMSSWQEVGRRVTRQRMTRGLGDHKVQRPRTNADRDQTRAMRQFARQHGIPIAERGRISENVRHEYELAH